MMYELFTGGGPHLTAPWSTDDQKDHRDEHYELKRSLRFPPPSEVQNEIRNDYRWLDALILRCLETDPARRIPDAGQLLAAVEACEAGGELPRPDSGPLAPRAAGDSRSESPTITGAAPADEAADRLFREARRLMAGKKYNEVIDRLDVHRPAEWAVLNAMGARTLRTLGQAFLGRGDLASARECLEQLRDAQRQQALLRAGGLCGRVVGSV